MTACVQIGHKGRFAFFRPATEPRNHAVSFRPFQSGKALCIQFGHRARLRGLSGHRAPPYPDAPDQTGPRHPTSLSRVAGPQQTPSCAVRPGTFHAAGGGLLRAGTFDAVGDRNPVPRRVRYPRPCGRVPGRAGCPRPVARLGFAGEARLRSGRGRSGVRLGARPGSRPGQGGPHASWARRERDDIAPACGARLLRPTASKENSWPTAPPPPSL